MSINLTIPGELPDMGRPWELLVDTADDHAAEQVMPGDGTPLRERSLKLFCCQAG